MSADQFWFDASMRRGLIEELLAAWDTGREGVVAAIIERVDSAIRTRLDWYSLPRMHEVSVELTEGFQLWLARWDEPSRRIEIAGDVARMGLIAAEGADRVVAAWLHESLHARGAFRGDARGEYRVYRGYEEGMISGLADTILRGHTDMQVSHVSFQYYVVAYRSLTGALGIEVVALWKELWACPPGTVRPAFVAAVSRLASLTADQQRNLSAVADQVFASSRAGLSPNERILQQLWNQIRR